MAVGWRCNVDRKKPEGRFFRARCGKCFKSRWSALPLILFIPALVFAQANARDLVLKMVDKELETQKQPRYWMYLDTKTRPTGVEVDRVIQTAECWIEWPVSKNGHPPTEEERKHASEQVDALVNDSDARKKNRHEIDSDMHKSADLLKMLPDAFLFTRDGHQGNTVRLRFRPNPQYRPTSNEAKVFHSMEGTLSIDTKQNRLNRLAGKLASDVDFGFGILGRLQKGGTFEVVQSQVASKDWEVSLLDVHISGRALFFHTIGQQQREVRSQFRPTPPNLSVAQAAAMVKGHPKNEAH